MRRGFHPAAIGIEERPNSFASRPLLETISAIHSRSVPQRRGSEPIVLPLLVLLATLQATMILGHVAWRDETQAYLVATQPEIADVFRALHYEGHPALWHLLLRAAHGLSPSLFALKLLQLPIALGVVALVWRRAPFGAWLRLTLVASYFLLFEYGVIARSYGLGVLLLFAFLATRRSPWSWLFLALMVNVSAHFIILSAILVAARLVIEPWPPRRTFALGIFVWVGGCVIAVATLAPAADAQPAIQLFPDFWINLANALNWASAAIAPGVLYWGHAVPAPESVLVGLAALPLGAAALASRPRLAILWSLFYCTLIALSALVYTAYGRHVGLAPLLLVALLWMDGEESGAQPGLAARAWIGALALFGLAAIGPALATPFSAGDMAVEWLRANGLDKRIVCAYPGWNGLDLSPRLEAPYHNLQTGRLTRFETWNYAAQPSNDPAALAALLREASARLGETELLVYSDAESAPLAALGARPLIVFPKTFGGDRKAFYAVTP